MPQLITLSTAKRHLRITTLDQDSDLLLKLLQAQDIVLDYLKTRATAIASISVANPTEIATSVPHSLVSGVTVPIAGTTTTPTVNGSQVITVTGPTTFTVPVNVTVGQTAAAGTVGSAAWTDVTLPTRVQTAILLVLAHLVEHRGDDGPDEPLLGASIERILMRSRDPALA